jgi:SAM-dependent methyltransferase
MITADSRTDWNRSAASYASIASTSRYTSVARAMVARAGVRGGTTIVDLACGTGTVTEEILRCVPVDAVEIIGIDQSREMLAIAKARLGSPAIRFALARAEELQAVVPPPVDRVLCNAAFWHMDMPRVLQAVRAVLHADGLFVVTAPDLSPDDATDVSELYTRSKLAWMLLEERAAIGRPLTPSGSRPRISQADIVLWRARESGFRLVTSETVLFETSAADTLAFIRMPALLHASPLLAGLTDDERAEVLRVVATELEFVDANVAPKLWRILVLAPATL